MWLAFYLLHCHGNLEKWYFIPVRCNIQLCWQQLGINALPGCMCFYRYRRPQCRLVTAISPAFMTNLLRQGHVCRGVFDNNTFSPRFIPQSTPDSKVPVANMGPIWVLAVGPMLALWTLLSGTIHRRPGNRPIFVCWMSDQVQTVFFFCRAGCKISWIWAAVYRNILAPGY